MNHKLLKAATSSTVVGCVISQQLAAFVGYRGKSSIVATFTVGDNTVVMYTVKVDNSVAYEGSVITAAEAIYHDSLFDIA